MTDAIVYAAFAALGAIGVGVVLRALFLDRPGSRMRGVGPRAFTMPSPPSGTPLAMSEAAIQSDLPQDTAPASEAELRHARAITDYPLLATPHVCLSGPVDYNMYHNFRQQLANAPADAATVVTITTLGGDPEVARLMGDEIRLMREFDGREFLFLGKVAVYSAGATFMSAFPVDKRFLTRGTRIMIHERVMNKTVEVSGPLKTCIATLKATLHEIEHSILIEEEGFRAIVEGSKVDFDDLVHRAPENWYIEADEARDLGLVLDVV